MVERTPTTSMNIDAYGNPEIPWGRLRDALASETPAKETPFFLGTVGPNGEPYVAGIGPVWHDGDFYVTTGPAAQKTKNLLRQPACTLAGRLGDFDLTMRGTAHREVRPETLAAVAARFRAGGWPCEVEGDAITAPYSAPSAGPPPWHLYRFAFDVVVALWIEEPGGATRWTFAPDAG